MISRFGENKVFWGICLALTCFVLTSCMPGAPEQSSQAAGGTAPAVSSAPVGKPERVVATWEEYEASPTPLLAAIPGKDIRLYAIKPDGEREAGKITEGVRLYAGTVQQEFEWPYLTPRFILPQLQSADYNGDGKEEISVILYVGSGTGVSIEELHILEQKNSGGGSGNGGFTDHFFQPAEYLEQLENTVRFTTFTGKNGLTGRFTIGDTISDASLKEYSTPDFGKINNRIVWGSIVRFHFGEGKLKAEFGAGITSDIVAAPAYIGSLYADVSFTGNRFLLENLRFEKNPV